MSHEKDISLVVVGTVILTVGVMSICAHLASTLNKQRILLWFRLFAAPYGCGGVSCPIGTIVEIKSECRSDRTVISAVRRGKQDVSISATLRRVLDFSVAADGRMCYEAGGAELRPGQMRGGGTEAVNIASWPSGLQPLSYGWLEHKGDDIAWANPNYNNNSWQPVELDDLDAAQPGRRSYRLHLVVPAGSSHLHLLIDSGQDIYELYLNGQQVAFKRSHLLNFDQLAGSIIRYGYRDCVVFAYDRK
jgi:hypothetical protein